MRDVHVVGVGMTKFGKYEHTPLAVAGRDAVLAALRDAGVDRDRIQAAYVGTVFGGSNIGQRIAKYTGMSRMPIVNVENACSSGSTAFREGWLAIASGMYDMVLVAGADKLSSGSGTLPVVSEDFEGALGVNMPAIYAMRARRYLSDYGYTPSDLGEVVVKNRRHATANPHAQFQSPVTLDEVMASRMIADPLTLFQCCPRGDGAAAAVLMSPELSRQHTRHPMRVVASQLCAGSYMSGYRNMAVPEVTVRAAHQAYEMAGLGPEDIDVAEVHDAFSISEVLYYEALQFCDFGQGVPFLKKGEATLDGRIPVNVSGGLLAKGHPPGATGIAQLTEIVWQLRGQAAGRQVANAKVGLFHCTGGGVSGYDHASASINIVAR
jgi:acetyl-CoA acetyltransferase